MSESIKYSAPGKTMLMGEHAVLHGYKCLSAAVDKRLYVELIPVDDKQITINSNLGSYGFSIDNISYKSSPEEFKFILAVIEQFKINDGFKLNINSDFPHTFGLGSSSAVAAATAAAMIEYSEGILNLNDENNLKRIFDIAYNAVLKVQNNNASGYDIATCIWGGIICYNKSPFLVEKLAVNNLPISLIYSGYKTKTADVIALVNKASIGREEHYNSLYNNIGNTVVTALDAVSKSDWKELGSLFNYNQKLLADLGVSDTRLNELIAWAQNNGAIGAKISGSGLGDCILALGEIPQYPPNDLGIISLSLKVTDIGICHE